MWMSGDWWGTLLHISCRLLQNSTWRQWELHIVSSDVCCTFVGLLSLPYMWAYDGLSLWPCCFGIVVIVMSLHFAILVIPCLLDLCVNEWIHPEDLHVCLVWQQCHHILWFDCSWYCGWEVCCGSFTWDSGQIWSCAMNASFGIEISTIIGNFCWWCCLIAGGLRSNTFVWKHGFIQKITMHAIFGIIPSVIWCVGDLVGCQFVSYCLDALHGKVVSPVSSPQLPSSALIPPQFLVMGFIML